MDMDAGTKACTNCGVVKPLDEFYVRNRATGYRTSRCKPCHTRATMDSVERRIGRPIQHRDSSLSERECSRCHQTFPSESFPIKIQRTGQRRSLCLTCHNARNEEYRQANPDKVRAGNVAYRKANRDVLAERQKRWREENPEAYHAIHAKWKANNKAAVNAATHRRRNQIAESEHHWTAAEWEDLKARYDHRCLACGRQEPAVKLTVDHVIPVSLGGSNGIHNIQPLCKSCNSKKHRGTLDLRTIVKWDR